MIGLDSWGEWIRIKSQSEHLMEEWMGREEGQNKDSSGWMELMKTLKGEVKEGMYDVARGYAVVNDGF